jgi:thiol-disulfide isomerase/thioredoxin
VTRPRRLAAACLAIALTAACTGSDDPVAPSDPRTPAIVVADAPLLPRTVDELPVVDVAAFEAMVADVRGTPLVVNFWATWCEPCITEWPQLDQLAKRLGDRDDVLILAVSIDNELGPIRPFLEQMSLLETEVGVVWDPTQEIHQAYGSEKIPDTFFVDEHGRLVQAFVNVRKWGSPEAFHCVDGSVGRSR